MEGQEKCFKDLQEDERLKKLKRNLKLMKIKKPQSSVHMSVSGVSSILGENQLSDFSFCNPSATSSRSGSVILSSSNNLHGKLGKNVSSASKFLSGKSSVSPQSLDAKNKDEDRMMMPPPLAMNNKKPKASTNLDEKEHAFNSTPKQSHLQNYENQVHSKESPPNDRHSIITDVSIEPVTNVEASRNNKSKHHGRTFRNWIVRMNEIGQIIIRGKLESGEQARSKPVKRRLTATTLVSIMNHKYYLVGDIHDVREELPEYVRGKFYNGFPTDWQNVLQIWQGYIVSGCNLRFRWPTPMADSDDDVLSDITDLTVARSKGDKTKSTLVPIPSPHPILREMNRSSEQKENCLRRERVSEDSEDSDISSTHSTATVDRDAGPKSTALEPSVEILEEIFDAAPDAAADIGKQNTQPDVNNQNVVPKWKVDIIIDNLMNKNCSEEYIAKFVEAMNCFNDLFTMPATRNNQSVPVESVDLNSNSQHDTTSNKNQSKIVNLPDSENVRIPRSEPDRPAIATLSKSLSLENLEESEEESRLIHNAHVRKITSILPEDNVAVMNRTNSVSTNNSSRHRPIVIAKLNDRVAKSASNAYYDSDVSILEEPAKPRIISIEKIATNLNKRELQKAMPRHNSSNEKNNHSQANSPQSKRNEDLNNEISSDMKFATINSPCTVQLTKVHVAQHNASGNDCMPSKSQKIVHTHKKSKLDTNYNTSEVLGSDTENLSMRTSSRGRRILPPLDYWNGERVTLKGQDLIYSPGMSTSSIKNSSLTKNTLSRSSVNTQNSIQKNSGISTPTNNLNKTPTGSTNHSKSSIKSVNRSKERIGAVLTEIPSNHDSNNSFSQFQDFKRITRGVTNKIHRMTNDKRNEQNMHISSTDSSEEETHKIRRKRRRILT